MGFKGFLATLYSPSFDKFITRRIAGGLYVGLVWLVSAAGALTFIFGLYQATRGGLQTLLIDLIGVPIATFISVVVLRLLFESSIALIVIAENTKRD